jgi:hypothetical protein
MFYVLVRRQPSAQPLSTAATDLKTLQKHRNKFRSLILIVRGLNSVFQFFFFYRFCPVWFESLRGRSRGTAGTQSLTPSLITALLISKSVHYVSPNLQCLEEPPVTIIKGDIPTFVPIRARPPRNNLIRPIFKSGRLLFIRTIMNPNP